MTKRSIGTALVIALMLSWGGAASAQQAKCLAGKTKCMSKKAGGLLKCEQTAETPGKPTDTSACRAKVVVKFDGGTESTKGCFEKLENKTGNDCITHDDTAAAEDAVDSCVAAFVAAIDPPPPNQTKCGAGKKKCVSKLLGSLLKCQATAQTPGKPSDQSACIAKAKTKYNGGTESAKGCFAKLEVKNPNDCQPPTNNSDALQTLVEDCVDDLVAVVIATSTSTTSTTTTTTTTTTLGCNPVDCNDHNACTDDTCDPASGCIYTAVDCHDDNVCTVDACDPADGCFYQPRDCNDDNACTDDTCDPATGECIHTPVDCNDGLRCTDDTCDPLTGVCNHVVDLTNCGPVQSCQEAQCSSGHDCQVLSFDDRCPPSGITCLAPQCTNSGCGVRDTCAPASMFCDGCAQCSCQISVNRCVPTCPS